ncbi:MAG TPA: outer membrane beta-barrel protein [Myxococcaceae bacterium]|nr:outer membrane beta-barrel protein [Myxococcaceae bacterium]
MSPHAARVLLFGALVVAAAAHAQVTSVNAALGENNGIRFGPGRLHPYFDLEGRYDSAAIYVPTDPNNFNGTYELKPEILMHFRPGFRLDVPGTDVTFGFNGFYDYVWYTGLLTSGSNAASHSEAGADMHAEFNREGVVEVDVADTFARSDRPRDIGLGVAVISLYNQLRLTTPIRPGGRAFEIRPHGDYTVEFFGAYSGLPPALGPCPPGTCPGNPADPSVNDYQNYAGGLDLHWKFLPQTALVFESNFEGRSYFHPDGSVVAPGKILKMLVGAQGLVTPKIQAILKAGYAIGFDGAASTFIGQGELTWNPNELSSLTAGVLRDVNNAVGAASATDLRVYLNTKAFLIGRLGLHANFSYDLISFTQGRGQNDQLFSIDLGPDYAVARWFILSAGYVLSKRSSDYAQSLPLNYTRNEAYLRLTFTY